METKKILVPESLQETLWRLEEVRQGFRNKSATYVQEALQWVLARQGLPGSFKFVHADRSRPYSRGTSANW